MQSKQALVIVDTQVRYVDDENPLHNRDQFIATLQSLLDRARLAGTPVVYIQHFRNGEFPEQEGLAGIDVHPSIAPRDSEPVIPKRASDSFYQSDLDATLRDLDVETLIVTGLQTEQCIDATSRSALSHGYDVVLVANGHTTWDSPILPAGQIIAHHNMSLPELAHPDRRIVVLTASEVAFTAR
jgi:nicotinamidase-related amidase